MIYRFDQYTLDTERLELRHAEDTLDIEPQVFRLLVHLIENRERVVGKEELIETVWAGRVVSDATLNTRINAVRRAVGDDGKAQSIIRTYPRRGFRFVAEVTQEPKQEGPGRDTEDADAAVQVYGSGAEDDGTPTMSIDPGPRAAGQGVTCTRCQTVNAYEAEYCAHCGARLLVSCQSCGAPNRPASFCNRCGTALPPVPAETLHEAVSVDTASAAGETEHRHLTVLYCELAGAGRLSARLDPEVLQDVMRSYQDRCTAVLEELGGYVARYVAGGILAYFGYPAAHEEDVERAVEAGLRVVEAVQGLKDTFRHSELSRLGARVGISTGTVVAGDLVGARASEQAAVLGETPQIAMQLCRVGESNTVVIGQETRRLAAGRFDYRDLGDHALNEVERPTHAWQVVSERRATSRFEATHGGSVTSLVGREEELAMLLRRWEFTQGGEGQVVLISGEPGIGKSRLVHALLEKLLDEEHSCVQYQCSAHHQASAFYPVIAQLEQEAGFSPDDTVSDRQDKLSALAVGRDDRDEHIALLAALLSVPPPNEHPVLQLEPDQQKEATLTTLVHRISARSVEAPLLCIFEDIHWIDPSTEELIERLVDKVPELPVCLVLTFRPELTVPWTDRVQTTSLTVSRMNPSESRELVDRLSSAGSLPSGVYDDLITKSEGVPLFLEELTRLALDASVFNEQTGSYQPWAALTIPVTLQDSLTARLDRVGPAKDAAQVAALIGREIDPQLLAAVMPLENDQLADALEQLQASGLVYPRRRSGETSYVFKHTLIQEAARSTLLPGTRRRLHSRIASALETHFQELVETQPELLAWHYTEAGLAEQAVAHWQQAGERATARAAHFEAISHFSEGLKLLSQIPEDGQVARREVGLRIATAHSMRIVERIDEALEHLERAEHVASVHGLTLERSHVHHLRGNLHFPAGNIDGCLNEHELALQYAREAGSTELEARALGGLGDAEYARGCMLSAYGYFSRCVEMCRKEGLEDIEAPYLAMAAVARHYRNEMHEALDDALSAYDTATRTGNLRAKLVSLACAAYPAFELAQFDRLAALADEILELADRLGASGWRSVALDHKAHALQRQGKRGEALEVAREGVAVSRRAVMQFVGPRLLSLLALLTDDPRQRAEALQEGEELLRAGSLGHNHLWFHRHGIELALEEKDWCAVEHHAGALEAYTRSEPLPLIDFYIARGRALAMHGKGTDPAVARDELSRLRKRARDTNSWNALEALEGALASFEQA